MNKINFQNLPSTNTPVNATNLNAIQTNVENEFKNYYNLTIGATVIASNTDLDNLTTPGTYRCESGAVASTLSNCPTNGAFKLNVEYLRNSSSIRQTIIVLSQNNITYVRSADANGFGTWQRIITDKEWDLTDIDWTSIGVTDTTVKYKRKGNIITVSGYSTALELDSGYTTVATLPSGSRPSTLIYGVWSKLGVNETGALRINTNGAIQLYGGTTAEKYWGFSITFIV